MKRILLASLIALMTGCAHAGNQMAGAIPDDIAAILIVQNSTPHETAVFLIKPATHIRLGHAAANAETRLPVKRALLNGETSFRVYAFRGQDSCPVARVLEIDTTRMVRMTVTVADTSTAGYLPADPCRALNKKVAPTP